MSYETEINELVERDYDLRGGAYGDQKVAAIYCSLQSIPCPINGEWQHGWIGPERNIHPEFVIGSDGRSYQRRKRHPFYVARQDQADYLQSQGYKKVHAIGLPILYVEAPQVKRIPGSLLVMPAHSLPETKEEWDADEYARYIKSIAPSFSLVCLCVHKSCVEKNNWVSAFKNMGIQIIEGADERDQNSYFRLASLFSKFEFVTTNAFGSQVAYGSYFGCKVAVAGPHLKWDKNNFKNLIFYKNCPELLDILEQWHSKKVMANAYAQFCCNPWDAQQNIDWANWQLGMQCKKKPEELKKLFGWNRRNWIGAYLCRVKEMARSGYGLAKRSVFFILHVIIEIQCHLRFRSENKIFTHLTYIEKMHLYKISRKLSVNSVAVEIGSYLGASTCFIAQGLKQGCKLYCIDTWGNHNMKYVDQDIDGEERDTYQEFMLNTAKHKDKIIPLQGWSYNIIETLKSAENHIDFLFIDGDHNYEGVKKDWDLFSPLLKKGSLIAFHDTGWAEGVNKVITDEVKPVSHLKCKLPNLEIYEIFFK